MQLNDEQIKAARFGEGICIVIAVPGSGKTLTMTHRIANLVNQLGQAPESILGLTFTRNAAEAMRQKLVPVLNDLAQRVTLSTIHSFCHYLLRCEGRMFTMLTGKEQVVFIRKIIKRLNVKELSLGMVLREISLSKNNLIDVEEFCDLYQSDNAMGKIAEIWRAYDEEKSKKMLLDFDDLLVESYRLLRDDRDIRDKYKDTFAHILVDEYQDINPLQFEIIKLLANGKDNGASFWACGDDWQSIYAFTGASVANIINFTQMFPEAQQMILNLNYRSTPQILAACHNLIRHNEKRIDKQLRTDNMPGSDVIVLESSSEETEALAILNEVRDLVERKGFDYSDLAVLYRCNFQSRVIEEAFCQHNIPYHIENGLCFYDRREVRLLLDYLRLIIEPLSDAGDESLKSIINVPNRYIGKKFIQELEQFQSGSGLHLFEKLKRLPIDLPYLRINVRQFLSFIEPLMQYSQTLQPAEVIHLLRMALDYDRFITDDDMPAPDDAKIENLNQLQMAAARFDDIAGFLEYTETFRQDSVSDHKHGVRLMTIHKSKGLEYAAVFIVGLVENILPSKKGNIEEERRICFVGMSRAMQLLYLSYSLSHLGQPSKKSQFIDEALGDRQSLNPTIETPA